MFNKLQSRPIASFDMLSSSDLCFSSLHHALPTSSPLCYLPLNIAPLGHVQAVQELHCQERQLMYFFGSTIMRTFRISLFLTRQTCWISAALCDTFSNELPVSWSSSFWVFEVSTSTPGCIVTLRTIFSPRKLLDRISTSLAIV